MKYPWRIAYCLWAATIFRLFCWLWVRHGVRGTRRIFHGPVLYIYAYLMARAVVEL